MINISELSYRYTKNSNDTLKNINIDIHAGEIFALLGPSGAGKSTLQKILIGLLPNYKGNITILDKPLSAWGKQLHPKIGVSFELPNHFSKLTARENLEFFLGLYPQAGMDILEALSMVGLADAADQTVGQFSKGMKNRLSFARALVHQPDIFFFDEPTTGLDPNNLKQFKSIIAQLKQNGKTILINTHNMTIAEQICDRVAFIIDGNIKTIGNPYRLKLEHGIPLVSVDFIENGIHQTIEFDLHKLGNNKAFIDTIQHKQILTIHSREASLEDVFIKLTGLSISDAINSGHGK